MNSSVGLRARAGISQYAATKHALKAVADSLRDECSSSDVRVCSFYLGATATPMQAAIRAKQHRDYKPQCLLQPEDIASLVTSVLALPRDAFQRIDMIPDVFNTRSFTRLKQLEYLIRTQQIEQDFFWRDGAT